MTADWHIQGDEVGTKHSIPVAVPTAVNTADDASRTRQSQYDHSLLHVDRTHSLDYTTVVDGQHESESQRKLGAAAVETFVSCHCGERITLTCC